MDFLKMPLTLIGRYNLAGPSYHPYRPAMGEMDVMFYRKSLTEVRKVIFNVSDVLHCNNSAATAGDVISIYGVSNFINDHFVFTGSVSGNTSAVIHSVHKDTGVETAVVAAAGFLGTDKIATSNSRSIAPGTLGASIGVKLYHFPVPSNTVSIITAGAVNAESAYNLGTIEHIPIGGDFVNVMISPSTITNDAGVYLVDWFRYVETGAGVFSCQRLQRFAYQRVNHMGSGASFTYGPGNSARPCVMVRDGQGKIYGLSHIPGTNNVYWHSWEESSLTGNPYTSQTDLLIPGLSDYSAVASGVFNRASHGAIHLNKEFQKVYFAASTGQNVSRLVHKKLPMSANYEFEEVDPTKNCGITGIWTFPPFVFVAKTGGTGATYGPQLIKYYDPDLQETKKPRRAGSETWELIPEIGQFLT